MKHLIKPLFKPMKFFVFGHLQYALFLLSLYGERSVISKRRQVEDLMLDFVEINVTEVFFCEFDLLLGGHQVKPAILFKFVFGEIRLNFAELGSVLSVLLDYHFWLG